MKTSNKQIFLAEKGEARYACPLYYGQHRLWWFTCPQLGKDLASDDTLTIRSGDGQIITTIQGKNFCDGLCYGSQEGYIKSDGTKKFPELAELTASFAKFPSRFKIQKNDKIDLLRLENAQTIEHVRNSLLLSVHSQDKRLKFNGTLLYHLGAPYGALFNPLESCVEQYWPSFLVPLRNLAVEQDLPWLLEEFIIVPLHLLIKLASRIENFFETSGQSLEAIQSRDLRYYLQSEAITQGDLLAAMQDIDKSIHQPDIIIQTSKQSREVDQYTDSPRWRDEYQYFIQQDILDEFQQKIANENVCIIQAPAGMGKSWMMDYWRKFIFNHEHKDYIIDSNEILDLIEQEKESGTVTEERLQLNDLISFWHFAILKELGEGYVYATTVDGIKKLLNHRSKLKRWPFLITFMQEVFDLTQEKTSSRKKKKESATFVIIHLEDLQKYLEDRLAEALAENITKSMSILVKSQLKNDRVKLILTTRRLLFFPQAKRLTLSLQPLSEEDIVRMIFSIFGFSQSREIGTIVQRWTGGIPIYVNRFFSTICSLEREPSQTQINEIGKKSTLWRTLSFRPFKEICTMFDENPRIFLCYQNVYSRLANGNICTEGDLRNEGHNNMDLLSLFNVGLLDHDQEGNISFANQIVHDLYTPNVISTYLSNQQG